MFCGHCGKELPEGAEFCTSCGKPVIKDEEEQVTVNPVNVAKAANTGGGVTIGNKQIPKYAIWIALIVVAIILFRSFSGGGGSSSSSDESVAISGAKTIISDQLTDPSSATWNSSEIVDSDSYHRYVVKLDVTATNGFGGRVREKYYVIVRVDGDYYYYSTYYSWAKANDTNLSTLKSLNGWDEPPKGD